MNQHRQKPEKETAIFRPFDPGGAARVYFRHLPHWRQPGATYFVTFRQSDSIPQQVLAEWLDIRRRWFLAHEIEPDAWSHAPQAAANAYRRIPEAVRRAFEREQAKLLHEELDQCRGCCRLREASSRQLVVDSLLYFQGDRWWTGDFVIMPNHVHALLQPLGDHQLEDLLGNMKRWTSRRIGETRSQTTPRDDSQAPTRSRPSFWQSESYDRIIRDQEELFAFRRYVARNPAAAGLSPTEFTYHAAEWLDSFAERPPSPYTS